MVEVFPVPALAMIRFEPALAVAASSCSLLSLLNGINSLFFRRIIVELYLPKIKYVIINKLKYGEIL